MALFKSPTIASASGSLGGITFSRNKGGMYLRARAVPTNPNTSFQAAIRAIVASLSNHWLNTLTEGQRTDWETYAANVELVNPLGDPINVTGLNMYIRSNTPRGQIGTTRIDDAPGIFNLGEFTAPTYAVAAATDVCTVSFTPADEWVDEDLSFLIVYASRPQNPSINFFKGPYRFMGVVEGDSVTPPSAPEAMDLPFPCVADQRLFFRARVSRADGRLSPSFRDHRTAS